MASGNPGAHRKNLNSKVKINNSEVGGTDYIREWDNSRDRTGGSPCDILSSRHAVGPSN